MKLAIHGHNYKATALCGLDRHNRRLNRDYGNENIDKARRKDNLFLIAPKENLYQDAKKRIAEQVIARGGRVTKASNWVTEFVVYAPEALTMEQQKNYFQIVINYFAEKVGHDNLLSAVVHVDEVHPHMHLDFTPIIENRLTSKRVMTRNFLLQLHNELPLILQAQGYDIQRGDTVKEEDRHLKGRSSRKYKSEIEKEKRELLKRCQAEKLLAIELRRNNIDLAKQLLLRERKIDLAR